MAVDYRRLARRYAQRYRLDPHIFERQIAAESGFNPNARSPAGATGIAQIMPATARGWGVDPNNPREALRAAAKNMAQYVRKYGGYENALRAYNAGPGAIERSRGYSETNNYVAKILRGRDPKNLSSANVASRASTSSTVDPGTSSDMPSRASKLIDVIARMNEATAPKTSQIAPTDTLSMAQAASGRLREQQAATMKMIQALAAGRREPAEAETASTPERSGNGGGGGGRRLSGPLHELFYNGPGGVNIDEGKRVGKGFVSGHTDHVHVAASSKDMPLLAKIAEQMGLHVREYEPYDPVDPVHTQNSFHYRGMAADISGDPKKMAAYSRRVASMMARKRR